MSTPRPSRKPPLHLTIEPKLHSTKPHEPMRHYIAGARNVDSTGEGRNYWLHATKGWRSERA